MAKFEGLIIDIDLELQNLVRLTMELGQTTQEIKEIPDYTQIRAIGSILHDFYTGLEKIFERIALTIDGGVPACQYSRPQTCLIYKKCWRVFRRIS